MIRVNYEDVPYGANEEKEVITDSGTMSCTNFMPATRDVTFATLEEKQWVLDGSRVLINPDTDTTFFWSSRASRSDGAYSYTGAVDIPTLTIQITGAPISTSGITFNFDEELYKMRLTYSLNGNTVYVSYPTVTAYNSVVNETVDGWDRLEIRFENSITPKRFVKLKNFVIGRYLDFTDDDLVDVGVVSEVDQISGELAVDTLSFTLKDHYGRTFNFQNRQKLTLRFNDKLIGVYYMDSAVRKSTTDYEISCVDSIGVLDRGEYLGGIYTNKDAVQLVQEIIDHDLDVSTIDFTAIRGKKITGYLPICTKREALNQVALALGVFITTYGQQSLKFVPFDTMQGTRISDTNIFEDSKSEISQKVSSVSVTAHNYVQNSTARQVFRGTISGPTTLTFSSPYWGYAISSGSGVTIDTSNSGANYVTVSGSGEVTITAKPYDDNTFIVRRDNVTAGIWDKSNIIEVKDATLVTSANAQLVCDNIYAYAQELETVTQTIIVTDEERGQRVTSTNSYGTQVEGFITKMNLRFTSHAYADITLVGTEHHTTKVAPRVEGDYSIYSGEIFWLV